MKLTDDYTEIVGVTHKHGEEECHNLLPQVAQLEADNAAQAQTMKDVLINAAELAAEYTALQKQVEGLRIELSKWKREECIAWTKQEANSEKP